MRQLNDGKQMTDVWRMPAVAKWEKSCGKHPTQKPLSLLARILLASTNENSWILLVTWYEGCSACKTWIANYTKEKKEKGFSELEKNGIKVICINPFAKDFIRMRKTEELLNAKGLLYSANGLHKVIDLYRFPSYYLISPNKEIVFSTSSIIKDNQIFVEEMQKHLP
jgi:hypothetical protein